MPAFGPGIRKIQIDAIDLPSGKTIRQGSGVHVDDGQVDKPLLGYLPHQFGQNRCIPFDGDIGRLRMHGRQRRDEPTFAGTNLNMQGAVHGEAFSPFPFHEGWLRDEAVVSGYLFRRIRDVAHSHVPSPPGESIGSVAGAESRYTSAYRAAARIASSMLIALAMPLPAMSKAVP